MNLLTLVLALPLIGFLVLLMTPRSRPDAVRAIAIAVSLVTFVVSIGLATGLRADG